LAVLTVDDCLDDQQVLGAEDVQLEVAEAGPADPGQHLVVEHDPAGALEDHVDQDAGPHRLVQPGLVGLLGVVAGVGEGGQHRPGVLAADAQVDVVGPAGPAEGGRGDPAHEGVWQAGAAGDPDGVGQHPQEGLLVDLGEGAGPLLLVRMLLVVHAEAVPPAASGETPLVDDRWRPGPARATVAATWRTWSCSSACSPPWRWWSAWPGAPPSPSRPCWCWPAWPPPSSPASPRSSSIPS